MRNSVVLLFTVFLSACTTTSSTVPIENKTAPVIVMIKKSTQSRLNDCEYLMRDLSIDWSSRRYWCGSSSTDESTFQKERNQAMLAAIERTRLRLAVLRERMNVVTRRTDYVATKISPRLQQPAIIKTRLDPATTVATVNTDNAVHPGTEQIHRIVFAQGRVVLGPRGKLQTMKLVPAIRNAHQITVRGRLMESEFQLDAPLAAERRSVGRSLSVRELWRSAGVDVATVTILHHSPDVSGKFVEVMINE